MRSPETSARQERPSVVTEQQREEMLQKEEEGSGVRERPKDPEATVQKFLFDSQQLGDEAKLLAKELPKFLENQLMSPEGLRQYRTRLTELVAYLQNAVVYGETIVRSGTPLRSMDQVKDGIVRNQEIIARAQEAMEESKRLEPKMTLPENPPLYQDRTNDPWEKRLQASPWERKAPVERAPQKKRLRSMWNPINWFRK